MKIRNWLLVQNSFRLFLFGMLSLWPVALRAQTSYLPPLIGNQWDTLSPQALGWNRQAIDSLYRFLDETNTKSFLVVKDGRIVLERYFRGFTQDSLHPWNSAGKTLTAFTVGVAQSAGLLAITDSTSKYLGRWTSCTPSQEAAITVRHQLTMTTGLDDDVPDVYCTLPSCLIYRAPTGTRWAYHNGPYTILDQVIQAATNQTLNQYFAQRVRNRIGMNGAFIQVGYNNLYVSNTRSMARFGLLMLNKGRWNNQIILSDTGYFRQMITPSQTINPSYGYLWWLNGQSQFMAPSSQLRFNGSWAPDAPAEMYAAQGKDGQILCIVPSEKLLLIRMGDNASNNLVPLTYTNEIWRRFNRALPLSAQTEKPSTPGRYFVQTLEGRILWHSPENYQPTNGYWVDKLGRRKPLAPTLSHQSLPTDHLSPGMYWLVYQNQALPVIVQ